MFNLKISFSKRSGVFFGVLILLCCQVFAEDRVPLKFDHEVRSCASQDQIWDDLQRALVDSSDSEIWPSELSSVEGRAELGAVIYVTYGDGWFAPTYSYELQEFSLGAFRYVAREDHPFIGGARVTVEPLEDGLGSVLKWDGLYWLKKTDHRGRRFFNSFSTNFFAQLNQNLKSFESKICNPSNANKS